MDFYIDTNSSIPVIIMSLTPVSGSGVNVDIPLYGEAIYPIIPLEVLEEYRQNILSNITRISSDIQNSEGISQEEISSINSLINIRNSLTTYLGE